MSTAMMLRELPAGERPRERMLEAGEQALANAELLAILIRTGTQSESAIALAQRLLREAEGLRTSEWSRITRDGRTFEGRPPMVMECSYAVTAWTQAVEDEHRLLSQVLAVLFAFPTLPADAMPARLQGLAERFPIEGRIAQPKRPLIRPVGEGGHAGPGALEFCGSTTSAEAAEALARLAGAIRAGGLSVSLGEEELTVFPTGDLSLEIDASERKGKGKLEVVLAWGSAKALPEE